MPIDLRERVARTLGWSIQQTESLPLQALRELVEPISSKLAHEIEVCIRSGRYVTQRT